MLLEIALKEFETTFSRSEKSSGIVQVREHLTFVEPFPLGSSLREYYARLFLCDKPSIGGALHLRMFTLDELSSAQHGWRWIRDKTGNLVESENWKSSWIVIADRNGDAIFIDAESPNGSTYGSIQQTNYLISTSLADFLFTLAKCMAIEQDKFNYEVKDDDFNVIEPFLDDVRGIAEENFGVEGRNGFMEFFFG